MSAPRLAVGVLASGRGSNLQAIIDAVEAGRLPAEIRVVVSDVRDAYALERARRHGIPDLFIDPKAVGGGRAGYDRAVDEALRARGVELVVLAGYMRVVGPDLVRAWPHRIMNIHPSLLPSFPGLHVQRAAVAHGVRFSGCTVHFVDEGVDTGPVIVQAVVPVRADDTEDSLAARILRQEHKIFPEAIRLFAQGRLRVEGRRVVVAGAQDAAAEESFLIQPPLEG